MLVTMRALRSSISVLRLMGHSVKMAGEHHAALEKAMFDGDKDEIAKCHGMVAGHIEKAVSAGKHTIDAISRALEAHGGVQADEKAEKTVSPRLFKSDLSNMSWQEREDGSCEFELFIPIVKKQQTAKGLLVSGWGSVSEYIDSQNEIIDASALRAATAT